MFPYSHADLPPRIELFLCSLELETTTSVEQTRRTLGNFMYEQVHNPIILKKYFLTYQMSRKRAGSTVQRWLVHVVLSVSTT